MFVPEALLMRKSTLQKNNSGILLTTVSKIWIFLLEGIFVF
jgi:uncharacterized membrane protein